MYTSVEISRSGKAFDECLFSCSSLSGILLNYRGKANGIVNSLKEPSLFILVLKFPDLIKLLMVEKAYCYLTASALFPIFFNNRGEAQHAGIYLKRPL